MPKRDRAEYMRDYRAGREISDAEKQANRDRVKAWREKQKALKQVVLDRRASEGLKRRVVYVSERDWDDFVLPLLERLATDKEGVLDPLLLEALQG